jgi:hypothetical protein
MVRTLAILMLMTPAAGMAQEPIIPGQTLSGALGPGDRTQNGRAFDDYRYSAVPGVQARVVVRSRQLAVDLNVYFYDDYFDMLPLVGAGSALEDSLEFTVPDVDSPTLIVIRVSTLAGDSGPATGGYEIKLSERQDMNRLLAGYEPEPGRSVAAKGLSALQGSCDVPPNWTKPYIEQSLPVRSPLTHAASICHSGSSFDSHLRGPLCVYDPPPSKWSGLSNQRL